RLFKHNHTTMNQLFKFRRVLVSNHRSHDRPRRQFFLTRYSWWFVYVVEITGGASEQRFCRKFDGVLELGGGRHAETRRHVSVDGHPLTSSVRHHPKFNTDSHRLKSCDDDIVSIACAIGAGPGCRVVFDSDNYRPRLRENLWCSEEQHDGEDSSELKAITP